MSYISRKNQDAHMERQWRAEIDRLRAEVDIKFRDPKFDVLPGRPTITASPNYLPNSAIAHSYASYTEPDIYYGTAGDDNRRAYNWFVKKKTDFSANLDTPLVSFGHSSFLNLNPNVPVWDQRFGRISMGWQEDLADVPLDVVTPLPMDFVSAGHRYYFTFDAIIDNAYLDPGQELSITDNFFYCGFYDTVNQTWLTGGDFAPRAVIVGAGGTRTLQYKIIANRDDGERLVSEQVEVGGEIVDVVVNAPDVLTRDNHVRLYYTGAAGYNRYEIYRYDGQVYRKVADIRNSIDLQFFDLNENGGSIEPGFPASPANKPIGYVESTGVNLVQGGYTSHTFTIDIPQTYIRAASFTEEQPVNTQFFRIGLKKSVSVPRIVALRRLMLSEGFGVWTPAAQDFLVKSGPVIIGDEPDFPPAPMPTRNPNQGPSCVTLDTMITVSTANGITEKAAKDLVVGDRVLSGWQYLPILKIKDGTVQSLIEITTERGLKLLATTTHRIVRHHTDVHGISMSEVKTGDSVLVYIDNALLSDCIVNVRTILELSQVRSIKLPPPHLFITNNIVSHNEKIEQNPYGDPTLTMPPGSDVFVPLP